MSWCWYVYLSFEYLSSYFHDNATVLVLFYYLVLCVCVCVCVCTCVHIADVP